jgi:hypothetical protein
MFSSGQEICAWKNSSVSASSSSIHDKALNGGDFCAARIDLGCVCRPHPRWNARTSNQMRPIEKGRHAPASP